MTVQELAAMASSPDHSRVPIQVQDGGARALFLWEDRLQGWGWIPLTDASGGPYYGCLHVYGPEAAPALGWLPAASPTEAAVCYLALKETHNYPAAFDALREWRRVHV